MAWAFETSKTASSDNSTNEVTPPNPFKATPPSIQIHEPMHTIIPTTS